MMNRIIALQKLHTQSNNITGLSFNAKVIQGMP
jgi:hypothetical protein